MSVLAAPLVSFFFSGIAIAAISAPGCSTTWEWVCYVYYHLHDGFFGAHLTFWFLCPVIQFSRPKCVYGRSVHDVNMQLGM